VDKDGEIKKKVLTFIMSVSPESSSGKWDRSFISQKYIWISHHLGH